MLSIAIRVDASNLMGIGHAMRCMTLGKALIERGNKVMIIARSITKALVADALSAGFDYKPLAYHLDQDVNDLDTATWLGTSQETDASAFIEALSQESVDLVIVDHYAIDRQWHQKVRPYTHKIMVIDDLLVRDHDCDLFLDQTYGRAESECTSRVPTTSQLLLGSHYAMLRPQFSQLRTQALAKMQTTKAIQRILLSFGGMDELNFVQKTLDALAAVDWDIQPTVDVVLTSNAPFLKSVSDSIEGYAFPINLNIDVKNMAEIMLEADLSVGSGGTTSWERCSMCLPTLLVVLAENQADVAKQLERKGAVIVIGNDENYPQSIKLSIENLMQNSVVYQALSKHASEVCDGQGVNNIVKEIEACMT